MKWYTGDEFPELEGDNSIEILIEFKSLSDTGFDSMTRYAAGDFYTPGPEVEDPYYCLGLCDDEIIDFENKKDFISRVERWCYL